MPISFAYRFGRRLNAKTDFSSTAGKEQRPFGASRSRSAAQLVYCVGWATSLVLTLFVMIAFNPAAGQDSNGKPYRYRTAVATYRQFLSAKVDAESKATVDRFRATVIDPNREAFTAVAARWLDDENLPRYVHAMKGISEQTLSVDTEFPARFDRAWDSFSKATPDVKPAATIFLLPAPRMVVGGSVRPLAKQDAVIFGTEEIASTLESKTGFDVLTHHELTHLYHMQVNPDMRRMIAAVYMPPFAAGSAKMYQVLWLEGLAVYMSKKLNPEAPDTETLLSARVAADVAALWPRLGADIREHLDSSKKDDIDLYLFDSDESGRIPRRSGYYVGMLIAEELAKKHTFPELCRLSGPTLRTKVNEALRELEKADLRQRKRS
jgi:hypothetical protein